MANYRKGFGRPQPTIGQVHHPVSVTIQYTESMTEMLDWFAEQPCSCATVGHIAHDIGRSRETVRQNLKQLMAGKYVEKRYGPTGEYRLVEDPRENVESHAQE